MPPRRATPASPPGEPPTITPRPLGEAPLSHALHVPADPTAEPPFLDLPAAPAVVIVESSDARAVLIATTADARALARRRFGFEPESAARAPRVDLRQVCAGGRVLAAQVGSALEADAVYLRHARERLPAHAKIVAERWRAWFAHVDPDAEFPQWTKTNLLGLVRTRQASALVGGAGAPPPGVLLGPLPDKDAAGRFIETVTDVFDLCRDYPLLVQAPRAKACAYKEMGRCPAPCDGSEGLPEYRARTRAAVDALAAGTAGAGASPLDAAMRAAAAEGDFERAALFKKQLDRLASLAKPAFAQVARLDAWRLLLVLPATTPKLARLALADRGRLWMLADVDPADDGAVAAACAVAAGLASGPAPAPDEPAIDTIGLLSRWLFLPAKKRRAEVLRLEGPHADPPAVKAAAARLLRAKTPEPPIESQELEVA